MGLMYQIFDWIMRLLTLGVAVYALRTARRDKGAEHHMKAMAALADDKIKDHRLMEDPHSQYMQKDDCQEYHGAAPFPHPKGQ